MAIDVINASMLKRMFLAGATNLEAKKEWINELNVFPVPDGDTGTNMTMTIMSAVREVQKLETVSMENLAKAISSGSLRGARGNSGVILSQLLRGFTKEISGVSEITPKVVANSFVRAADTAYKAVMKPKEGTILTVARGMADKATELAPKANDMEAFLRELIEYGDLVLNRTPDMLPVLKQAGVVDSGGQGLMQVLKGALDGYLGNESSHETVEDRPGYVSIPDVELQTDEFDIQFGYCTEFIVNIEKTYGIKEEMEFKGYLESIGDSIVVVSDEDLVKVHVHTNDPGLVIQKALTYGSLTSMKIDNMREEHQEKVIKSALKKETKQKMGMQIESGTSLDTKGDAGSWPETEMIDEQEIITVSGVDNSSEINETFRADTKPDPYGFIVVSIGEGMNEIFKSLHVDHIIEGGQTMNPSTEDVLNAIDKVNAETIFIFPNNKNIILAAEQAKRLTEDKNIIVIPSKTVPQGITAIISFMPDAIPEENRAAMEEEMSHVKTGQVTYAVRDTSIDGLDIKKGDIMGIGDHGILALGTDVERTTLDMLDAMMDEESELISIYYGSDVPEADALALLEETQQEYTECDIEMHRGGQPIYYYVVSVE